MRQNGSQIMVFCGRDRTGLVQLAEGGLVELVFALRPPDQTFAFVTAGLDVERGHVPVLDAVQPGPEGTVGMPVTAVADILRLDTGTPQPPVALVRLRVDPQATAAQFEVRLATVAKTWTYHVVGAAPDSNLNIRHPDGRVTFTSLGAREGGDVPSLGFRSDQEIGLSALPSQRFELLGGGPLGRRVIIPALPTPKPGPTAEVYVRLN
jgi:hypothetical protein